MEEKTYDSLVKSVESLIKEGNYTLAIYISNEAMTACRKEFPVVGVTTYQNYVGVLVLQERILENLHRKEDAIAKRREYTALMHTFDTSIRAEAEARQQNVVTNRQKDLPSKL